MCCSYRKLTTAPRLDYGGGVDPGLPLFLTPLIESGNVTGAQQLALNEPLCGGTISYSGFLTVDKTLGSNMFFWFFPAQQRANEAPVLLWLQGGPGASSMYGLFSENGPYISVNGTVTPRELAWTSKYNVLYIDNPVGTGYSFTQQAEGYARDETQVREITQGTAHISAKVCKTVGDIMQV